jgi:RNA polymerase-binding transcription factor DksA
VAKKTASKAAAKKPSKAATPKPAKPKAVAAAKKPAAKPAAAKTPKAPAKKPKPAADAKADAKKVETKKPAAAASTTAKPAPKSKASQSKSGTTKSAATTKPASAKGADKPTDAAPETKAAAAAAKGAKPPAKGKKDAKAEATKPEPAKSEAAKPAAEPASGDDKKSGRKGITIVNNKPAAKPKTPGAIKYAAPTPRLLGPDSPLRRPLISSGPAARRATEDDGSKERKPKKSPFTPKQLEHYREVLLTKRAQLIGDVTALEQEALRGQSGGLSSMPQHLAEQGSDSADQTLSLNLAAADRKLIKEIDDALQRIADGTYGICELTGHKIAKERLDELPWTRHSIEGARLLERGGLPVSS